MSSYLLAALSGVLFALGNERPECWPLAPCALAPLLVALQPLRMGETAPALRGAASARPSALRLGLCMGLVTQLIAYRWLLPTLHEFSGLPWGPSALAWGLLMLYQAGPFALWSVLCVRAWQRGRVQLWVAPVLYGAIELVYPMLFPSPLASSLHPVPVLLQGLELTGTTAISIAMVAVSALLARFVQLRLSGVGLRAALVPGAAIAGIWVGLLLFGTVRMAAIDARAAQAPSLHVGLVQANLAPHDKRRHSARTLERHLQPSRALVTRSALDLVIWPETALPQFIPEDTHELPQLVEALRTPLLFGAVAFGSEGGGRHLHNSAFLIDAKGRVLGRDDKQRLVPFAERLPFGERFPVLYDLVPGAGHFMPGREPQGFTLAGHRFATLVCYEDILADLVRDVVARTRAELLINITNDAWFGDTPAPHFHLALATLRSIELRRALVRATNSGVSAIVDPVGRVIARMPSFTAATLTARVPLLNETTVYARFGDVLGWLALALGAYCVLGKPRVTAP